MLLILACSHDSLICLVELAFPRELLVGCLVGCLVLSLVVNANQTCWCSFVGCCLVAVRLPLVGPALLAVCVLCVCRSRVLLLGCVLLLAVFVARCVSTVLLFGIHFVSPFSIVLFSWTWVFGIHI